MSSDDRRLLTEATNATATTTSSSLSTASTSRGRRRMSVDDSVAHLISHINRSMDRLRNVWDNVHMDNRTREARTETAYAHFHQLLDDLVISEEEMEKGLASDIYARRLAIAEMRDMLGLKPFFAGDHPEGSIALMKALDKELKKLYAKRDEAVSTQLNEYRQFSEVCHRLGIEPPVYDDLHLKIISFEELRKLKQVRAEASRQLTERLAYVTDLQSRAKRMYDALRLDESFTPEEVNALNTNFATEDSIISEEVQTTLSNLCDRLKPQYDAWVEVIEFEYDEMMIEYNDLRQKLCIGQNSSPFPSRFDPDLQSHTDLAELRNEVTRLNSRYENGQKIYDQLAKWAALWREQTDLELQSSSSQFYNNRGGCLTTYLKRKKQLAVELPKALDDLKRKVAQHIESGASVEDILIDGVPADEHVESLMAEYEMRKGSKKTDSKILDTSRTFLLDFYQQQQQVDDHTKVARRWKPQEAERVLLFPTPIFCHRNFHSTDGEDLHQTSVEISAYLNAARATAIEG